MESSWNTAQKYAGLFLFEIVFWALVLALGFWLGFPGNGLFVGVIAVLNIIIGMAGYFVTRDSSEFSSFQTATKRQLSEEEAYNLARYMLPYRRGYRVERVVDRGIDPAVSASDDKEDAVRLFKLEFEPLNVSGRATLYMDLEQELSVDLDDLDSFENAIDNVQNVRIVKSWTSTNYEEKVQEVKESLDFDVELPFSSTVEILDSRGASDSISVNVSESDSGLREHSYRHSLDLQRVNRTVSVFNDGSSRIDSGLSLDLPGSIVGVQSWEDAVSPDSSVTKTGISEGDWIRNESERTFSKYEDEEFRHGEDAQRLVNRTELVVNNILGIRFDTVNISTECSRGSTSSVPAGEDTIVTTDCNQPTFVVDTINEKITETGADTGFSHNLTTQGVYQEKRLNETGGISWTSVNVSSPSVSWSCENCAQRSVDLPASETRSLLFNSSSDWVVNESEPSTKIGEVNPSEADINQQFLYNQSGLRVDNTQSFGFDDVDISSKCSLTSSADIPSGESIVTEACNNNSFSGDWIKNEESGSTKYASGPIFIGKGFNRSFTATQGVEATNVRTSTDLQVNVDSLVSETPGCSVVNSSQQTFSADSVSSFTFHKSCSSGSHLNRTPVVKTEADSFYKYGIEFGFRVNSNLTEEQDVEYVVKKSWLDNWNRRDPTETEAFVDGSSKDISIQERVISGTEYVIFVIGDEHGNSSLHQGIHSASLSYFESKSPGSTSGGSESGSGGNSGGGLISGGSGSETPVEEVTSDKYNWSVSAITSEDSRSFQISGYPGATFEKYIVVRNTGDNNVTLDVDCVSLEDQCSWVDVEVDRVVLNRNSFSEKTIAVSGTVPESFRERDSPVQFSIQVSDPEFNGSQSGPHVGYVDFTVTDDPFLGRALDVALKILEGRELESPVSWGNSITIPFFLIPVFWASLVMVLWSMVEWLNPLRKDIAGSDWSTNLKWVSTVGVFLFTYIVL
ncbi:hypothetical protein [Salarchaeum japonicum]|uniref:Uncharacterized protein n=1 Tax=Salarchaeum japonicum TaxID=555573 RepID=A0AAV3SZ79_9EURY|nr:hypothetical protein [Salarchaeum japonicum]